MMVVEMRRERELVEEEKKKKGLREHGAILDGS